MGISAELLELAHRLAAGARAQAARDHRRFTAITQLPRQVYHVTGRQNYELILREDRLLSAKDLYARNGDVDDETFLRSQRRQCMHLGDGTLLRD
jgi:hypothetical protein